MKILGACLVASLALVAAASGAAAADLVVDQPAIAAATTNWDGGYAGVGIAVESSTTIAETIGQLSVDLGVNKSFDKVLLGAEAYLAGSVSSLGGAYGTLGGRVRGGVLASDAVLVYGAVGAEVDSTGNTYAYPGIGVEFAVSDSISIDVQYKYLIGLNNGWQGHHIGVSANWHF